MRSVLVPAALLLATLLVGGALVWQAERHWADERRDVARQTAASAAFALEQQVSRATSATYTLAMLVRRDPKVEDFERLAAAMLPHHGAVANLQLAPGAVIGRIYPLEGNETAIGHDLLHDPDRRFQAQEAITTRRLTVAGPFELRQGGTGLIGRLAVFLPDPAAPSGERFWGLVGALVRVPPLLEAARTDHLREQGYAYRLERRDPDLRRTVCFAGCDGTLAAPVTFDVSVPSGAWTLSLAPARGWPAPPWRTSAWLLVLAAAAAVAVAGRAMARQPDLLRQQVAARTAELHEANAALAAEMARLKVAEEAARKAREDLRQAQKMEAIGKLAGGVAHDFNNLLTGILGYASVLQEESPAGSSAREAAETIGAAAQRAAELTRQLLGFSRQKPAQTIPFDAHETVREVLRLAGSTLAPRITVQLALGAPRAVVIGDPGSLQQALLNLVVNARDAMPEGGTLRLESALVEASEAWQARHPGASAGPLLTLAVADTGPGVPPELRERIFEPFFTTKEPGRGTGLGLAMAYGVARAHRGGLELDCAPGPGARFTLSLPLAPPGVTARPSAGAAAVPRRGGTVLVVDDDPVPRAATAAMLAKAGYRPVEAGSAAEGTRWVEAHPGEARVAVIDVVMPGQGGVDGLLAMRGHDPALRAVFISGHTRDLRAQEATARGEAGWLSKPFDLERLVAAVEEAPPAPGAAGEAVVA